jgi:hypothetical protein
MLDTLKSLILDFQEAPLETGAPIRHSVSNGAIWTRWQNPASPSCGVDILQHGGVHCEA